MYENGRFACFSANIHGPTRSDRRGGVECSISFLAPEILQAAYVPENVIAISLLCFKDDAYDHV